MDRRPFAAVHLLCCTPDYETKVFATGILFAPTIGLDWPNFAILSHQAPGVLLLLVVVHAWIYPLCQIAKIAGTGHASLLVCQPPQLLLWIIISCEVRLSEIFLDSCHSTNRGLIIPYTIQIYEP